MGACCVLYRIVRNGCRNRLLFHPGAEDRRRTGHCSGWARGRHRRCNLYSERSRVAADHWIGDGATRRISAVPAVVAMVDRAVCIDRVLLAAGGVATGPDAESSGTRDAGGDGVATRVFPILSLVVLSRMACLHRGALRLLSDGGEACDMIERWSRLRRSANRWNRSASIDIYRPRANCFDGKSDARNLSGVLGFREFGDKPGSQIFRRACRIASLQSYWSRGFANTLGRNPPPWRARRQHV